MTSSNIGQTLIQLASRTKFDHLSARTIRHGYMAVVVKIANLLLKNKEKDYVGAYLASLGEDWPLFIEGELKRSNETNTKSLGGQQPRNASDEDDDMDGHMSMDSILSRFSNFNTKLSQSHSVNNDDEEEDEEEEEEEPEEAKPLSSP